MEVESFPTQNTKFQDAICWDSDGQTILIKDTSKLANEVLPVVFKQRTLKSFIRQVQRV